MPQRPTSPDHLPNDDGAPVATTENVELLATIGAGFLAFVFLAAVIVRGGF